MSLAVMSIKEPREVRSRRTEKQLAAGNMVLAREVCIYLLPICELILLISTQVLSSPSPSTPRKKLVCPTVRKNMLPINIERKPLKTLVGVPGAE